MFSVRLCVLALFVLCGLSTDQATSQEKPTLAKTGWIDDPKLMKLAPSTQAIVSEKALQALYKSWKLEGEIPKIDFTKELVVVMTGKGGGAFAAVQDKADLKTTFGGPPKDKPGFAYIMQTVSRTGVKTINGKLLPKQ